jgi:hypothetical protein
VAAVDVARGASAGSRGDSVKTSPVLSFRSTRGGYMLDGMRMQVEVQREDEDPLRTLAFKERRSVREQAAYLLHLKIQEASAQLSDESEPAVAEVA